MTAIDSHCYSEFFQRQVLACFLTNPHYGSLINANGHAEVWTDWNDMSKFFQYGWRCNTNEDAYSNHTLMGNWNQERYDIKNIMQPKPLPSQFGHYFGTTYDTSYNNRRPVSTHRFKREPHWFPGHQPELVPPPYKCTEKSIYMSSYSKPQIDHHSVCVWNPSNCNGLSESVILRKNKFHFSSVECRRELILSTAKILADCSTVLLSE